MKARSTTLALIGLALFFLVSVSYTLAGEEPAQAKRLSYGDTWYYKGEIRRDSGERTECNLPHIADCPYCSDGYCAHGFGSLSHDGSWGYTGTFVDGLMLGHGSYYNDFFKYVGGFERGNFDGHGILMCLGGRKFEGIFDDGKMTGQFKVITPDGVEKTKLFSGGLVGWVGPCES